MAAAKLILLLLFIFHLQWEVLSLNPPFNHDANYMKFVCDATDLEPEEEYDYIIIGGGTAGCPLAATLSEKYSILILERGDVPLANPDILHIDGFGTTLMQKDNGDTPAQIFTSEDGVKNVRGRVLGGSSMINCGLYSRAEPKFYEEESKIDWDMDLVEKSYHWVEESLVSDQHVEHWQSVVKDALLEAKVFPYNGIDLNHKLGTKFAGSTFDPSGWRHGAVELLNKANPKNLRVAIHAYVEQIIFSSSSTSSLAATGVIFSDSKGKFHKVSVRNNGEVILSAGTLGSPQLLLLSGVGPTSSLSSLKIPVVHEQPYVGEYVVDNPRNNVHFLLPVPMETSLGRVVGIEENFYIEAQSSALPFYLPPPFGVIAPPYPPVDMYMATILEKLPRPLSVGSYKLASSTDVKKPPILKFNYFSHPLDLVHCVNGMRKIGKVLKTRALEPFKSQKLNGPSEFKFIGQTLPVNQSDDAAMEEFCRRSVTTMWHYHGGCVAGKVVDGNLRVLGIDALRVIDASTYTVSPGTNPQATTLMLGRHFGLKILQEREASSSKEKLREAS